MEEYQRNYAPRRSIRGDIDSIEITVRKNAATQPQHGAQSRLPESQSYMNDLEQTAVYPQLPHVQATELKKRQKKIREPSQELLLQ